MTVAKAKVEAESTSLLEICLKEIFLQEWEAEHQLETFQVTTTAILETVAL